MTAPDCPICDWRSHEPNTPWNAHNYENSLRVHAYLMTINGPHRYRAAAYGRPCVMCHRPPHPLETTEKAQP